MTELPLDLKDSVHALWWRRRLVGALAGIGLVAGLAYAIFLPPMPSAVALVLLPPTNVTSAGTPTRDVNTEIVIATSTPVLSAAGTAVSPPIAATTLKHRVSATALSQDVLQIQVSASTGAKAETLANAVAAQYIQFVATSSSASTKSALAGLQQESAQLSQQIQGLQAQINTVTTRLSTESASSSGGQQDSALLGSLTNEQQQVSLQIDNVNNQVVTDQLSGAAAAQGTRILQKATTATTHSVFKVALTGVLGLVLGLVVGIPLVLVGSRRLRRLRRRDEVAAALGVPVLGSIEAPRRMTTEDWAGLLDHYDPPAVDVWNLRRMLQKLAPEDRPARSEIRVVSFAADDAAAAAGPQLAMFAEGRGVATTLVPSADEAFSSLRIAYGNRPLPSDQPGGRLTVSMAVIDPDQPELHASEGSVLLAVSSGFATAEVLARLSLASADAGHVIDGVVVVNPEPSDTTTGLVRDPDTVHLSPAHHNGSVEVALPAYTNGNGHVPVRTEPDDEPGTFVSLRVLAASAKTHWRQLAAVALVGMLMGAGLHLVIPRKYAATTSLYLSEPTALDPAQAMANDVSLLQTRAVAQRALASLHLNMTPASFIASYQGVALSNAILVITVGTHSPAAAVSRANAVARAFLTVRTELLRLQTQVVVGGMNGQVRTLNAEVNNLTQSVNALSANPTGTTSGNELANLIDQRSEDASQVATLESQIQQQQLNETSVTQGSLVLDRGALVKLSAKKVTIIDALSGLVGGLGLALVILIIAVLVSDRVRNRAQVAAALGAPVELSLMHSASRRALRPRRRLKLVTHPTPALAMMERRLRAHLEADDGAALAVVEVEASGSCALAVTALAYTLASEGRRVVIADMAQGRPVAELLGVTRDEKKLHAVTIEDQSVVLMVAPDDPIEMGPGWTPKGADVLLVVASADVAFGSEHLAAWVTKAVVVVNMKRATAAGVSATGELLRQARITIRSAIVIGTNPKDDASAGGTDAQLLRDHDQRANGVLQTARR